MKDCIYYYGRLVSKEYEYELCDLNDFCIYTEKNIIGDKKSLIRIEDNEYIDVETSTKLSKNLENEIFYKEVEESKYQPKKLVLYGVCDLEVAYVGSYFDGLLDILYRRLYLKNSVEEKIKKKELK